MRERYARTGSSLKATPLRVLLSRLLWSNIVRWRLHKHPTLMQFAFVKRGGCARACLALHAPAVFRFPPSSKTNPRFSSYTRGGKCQPFQSVLIFGELGGRPNSHGWVPWGAFFFGIPDLHSQKTEVCRSRCMHYDHGTSMIHGDRCMSPR